MSVAAIAAVAAAAAGATSVAPISPTTSTVHPVVLGVPLPLAPSADVPSSDQLLAVLNGLGNPNVPFANKSNLVEGGISPVEARLADVRMRQAVASGETPLRVSVANIHPTGANAASADVTVSGPKLAPTTRSVTFVNHGGWKITHASAISLLQESGAGSS
ncbi:hypothetical protein [Mycobacterium sp.]|uniref:hypothetical protein n=1 Tax=Mycobacterium sp. TaxID=1785 RepID=UPI003D6A5C4D